MKDRLKLVLQTLDRISVTGRDNIDMMLGVMLTIEKIIKEDEEAEKDG